MNALGQVSVRRNPHNSQDLDQCVTCVLPPPRPIRITSGVDRYGFSSVLAQRCGLRAPRRSFANWLHGWMWHDELDAELLACARLPRDVTIVVCNELEKQTLTAAGFPDVRIGGLPLAYVPQQNSTRIPHAVLAVPAHSAEAERLTSDQCAYMDYLESIKGDFEGVYISIFHIDVDGPMHKAARSRGLRVIQGARPDDANSLIRTRTIFDSFEYVTTNVIGSHVLYALYAGCRMSFCGPIYGYDESVYLGGGNPHGHSVEYVRRMLRICSESYLRERFARFFVNHPRNGVADHVYARYEIGERYTMSTPQILSALGWTLGGQITGYSSGARRRIKRLFTF